jgi:hypothetical protein
MWRRRRTVARKRTYHVFMAYDESCFTARRPFTTSKKRAAKEATAEFLQWLGEQGYEDVRAEKLTAKAEPYEGEKEGD